MAKSPKKTSKIEAVEKASKQHIEVCRFLRKKTVRSELPTAEFKDPYKELVLLDRLIRVNGPITAEDQILKGIGSESTLFYVTKRLNKLLENFSNKFEVLKKSNIIISVHHRSEIGGLRVGRYFTCQNTYSGEYLDASKIRQLLDKAWKDFWKTKNSIEQPETIERRLKKQLKKQANFGLTQKLYQTKLNQTKLGGYQPLEMEAGLVRIEEGSGRDLLSPKRKSNPEDHYRIWKDFDTKELLSPQRVYILSSDTGTGKTTFLRNLQLCILKEKRFLPIFVHAAKLQELNFDQTDRAGAVERFILCLEKVLSIKAPRKQVTRFLKNLIKNQRMFLIVDGLDQIEGTGTAYKDLLERLFYLFNTNLIIASRPFAIINCEENKNVIFLRLKPFNQNNQENYFDAYYNHACELCASCPELMAIPMLAYMVRTLIEKGKHKQVKNRAGLYKQFIDYIISADIEEGYKHDNIKSNTDIQAGVRRALAEISFEALAKNNPYIQIIPPSLYKKYINPPYQTIENILKHGLANLILDKTEGIDKCLYFSHQTYQEYLAAEWAVIDQSRTDFALNHFGQVPWSQVVIFMSGIEGEALIEKIYPSKSCDNVIHSRLFFAAKCSRETDISRQLEDRIVKDLQYLAELIPFKYEALRSLVNMGTELSQNVAWKFVKKKVLNNIEDDRCYYLDWDPFIFKTMYTEERMKWLLNHINDIYCGDVINVMLNWPSSIPSEYIDKIIEKICTYNDASYIEPENVLSHLSNRISKKHLISICQSLKNNNKCLNHNILEGIANISDKLNQSQLSLIIDLFKSRDQDVVEQAVRIVDQCFRRLSKKNMNNAYQNIVDSIAIFLESTRSLMQKYALVFKEMSTAGVKLFLSKLAYLEPGKKAYILRGIDLLSIRCNPKQAVLLLDCLNDKDELVVANAIDAVVNTIDLENYEHARLVLDKLSDNRRMVTKAAMMAILRVETLYPYITYKDIEIIIDNLRKYTVSQHKPTTENLVVAVYKEMEYLFSIINICVHLRRRLKKSHIWEIIKSFERNSRLVEALCYFVPRNPLVELLSNDQKAYIIKKIFSFKEIDEIVVFASLVDLREFASRLSGCDRLLKHPSAQVRYCIWHELQEAHSLGYL